MKLQYPELKDIHEFDDLNSKEMKVCWMIASPSSKIRNKYPDKAKRIQAAIESVYSKRVIESSTKESLKPMQTLYKGKSVPSKYKDAIVRFASFSPSARMRATWMAEQQLDMFESLSYISQEDQESMGPADYQEYVKTMSLIQKQMPTLISQVEGGFGVEIKTKVEDDFSTEYEIKAHIDSASHE